MCEGSSAVCSFLGILLDSPCEEPNQLAVDPAETRGSVTPAAGQGGGGMGVSSWPALGPTAQGQVQGAE